MAVKLKARRVAGGPTPLMWALIAVILALAVVIVVFLANSALFNEPTAAELARDEVLAALADKPGDPGLLMMLAEIEYNLGRTNEALDYAAQAAANAGETLTIHQRYAILLMQEERLDEAKTELEAELALDERASESFFMLGQVERELGNIDASLAAFESALSIDPFNGDFRVLYADALALAGRTMEAVAAYESALQVLPDDERAIQGLTALGITYEPTETVNPHGDE